MAQTPAILLEMQHLLSNMSAEVSQIKQYLVTNHALLVKIDREYQGESEVLQDRLDIHLPLLAKISAQMSELLEESSD